MAEKYCFQCGNRFNPIRSDQMYCSSECRINSYKPHKRDVTCSDCSNRSDKYGTCTLWKTFHGKTHPRDCTII